MPIKKLKEFLDANHVKYVSVVHSQAYTAQEVAASAHVSGKAMAKTVIVELDGQMAMAVLPANRKIVLQDLREVTGSDQVKFASEERFKDRFPDCEIGAMPPFGPLYGMEVYVADRCPRMRRSPSTPVRIPRSSNCRTKISRGWCSPRW